MSLINFAYNTVQIILNKNSRGVITPDRFNSLCRMAQNGIYNDLLNQYRGLQNKQKLGRSSVDFTAIDDALKRYLVSDVQSLTYGQFPLPSDFSYFAEQGIIANDREVAEIPSGQNVYYRSGLVTPTDDYPQFKRFGVVCRIYPSTITSVDLNYFRHPLVPKWTYQIINNEALFDPSQPDYQDLDIYENEIENLIIKIVETSGVHIRDNVAIQVSQQMQQSNYAKNTSL